MKKGKRLLLLSACIAVLIVGTFILKGINDAKKAEETTPAQMPAVLTLDKEGIREIAYTNEGQSLRFTKVDGKWQYAGDAAFPVNESQITAMAAALSNITASRKVADTLDKADEYGLKAPALTVWVTGGDGKTSTLFFGNKNSVTGDTYLYLDGSTTIYTVSSSLASKFNSKLYALIASEAFPTMDASLVSKLSYTSQDKNLLLTYYEKGNDASYSSLYQWFAQGKDGKLSPLDTEKVNAYLEGLTSVTPLATVAYDATPDLLTAYGLDAPQAVIAVDYSVAREESVPKATDAPIATAAPSANPGGDAAVTATGPVPSPMPQMETVTVYDPKQLIIYLGKQAEDGSYYMRHSDSKRVFTISEDTYQSLAGLDAESMKPVQFGLISIDTVDSLDVAMGGSLVHFTIERTKTTDASGKAEEATVYKREGTEVKEADFKNFYASLISLEKDKVTDQKGSSQPYMSVTYHRNTASYPEITLNLYPYDSSFYMADFNGESGLLVNKRMVETLVKDYAALGN